VREQACLDDQAGAAGEIQDLPFALGIEDPGTAHGLPRVGTVDLGVFDDRLPDTPSERSPKPGTCPKRIGRQHLRVQNCGFQRGSFRTSTTKSKTSSAAEMSIMFSRVATLKQATPHSRSFLNFKR
jgi:hypothetical protein